MAVPSRRLKAGAREIRNRQSKESEERRKSEINSSEPISKEEHEERLRKLKEIGLIK